MKNEMNKYLNLPLIIITTTTTIIIIIKYKMNWNCVYSTCNVEKHKMDKMREHLILNLYIYLFVLFYSPLILWVCESEVWIIITIHNSKAHTHTHTWTASVSVRKQVRRRLIWWREREIFFHQICIKSTVLVNASSRQNPIHNIQNWWRYAQSRKSSEITHTLCVSTLVSIKRERERDTRIDCHPAQD